MSDEELQQVVLAVVYRYGEVLMEWRSGHPYAETGQWVFPGGKVEDSDSTPHAALLREVWEEVGVYARTVHLLKPVKSSLGPYILMPGLITSWEGTIRSVTDRRHRLSWRTIRDMLATNDTVTRTIINSALRELAGLATHP